MPEIKDFSTFQSQQMHSHEKLRDYPRVYCN